MKEERIKAEQARIAREKFGWAKAKQASIDKEMQIANKKRKLEEERKQRVQIKAEKVKYVREAQLSEQKCVKEERLQIK